MLSATSWHPKAYDEAGVFPALFEETENGEQQSLGGRLVG